MKYFVFGDVHGFYDQFIESLKKSGFDENNNNHKLISLGDNFDRGTQNYKMFCFLKKMKKKNKIVLIKGNHEDLIVEMLFRKKAMDHDYHNGTFDTIIEFASKYFDDPADAFKNKNDALLQKLKEEGFLNLIYDMIDYYETDNYVFTHGYIPVVNHKYVENWRNLDKDSFKAARWLNGMEQAEYYKIFEPNKKIVVGHWHSSYGNVRKHYGFNLPFATLKSLEFSNLDFFKPYEGKNIIAIDACTVHSKMVNIIVVDD